VQVTPTNTVEVTVVSGTTTLSIAGHTTTLSAGQVQTFGSVAIDIKPGSATNSIHPRSQGKIPVAILSHATLDAPTQVDRASLTFGRTGDEQSLAFCDQDGLEDVNGDGRLDLVCHFHTPAAGFRAGDTQGMLKGQTSTGVPLTGLDAVRIVPVGR